MVPSYGGSGGAGGGKRRRDGDGGGDKRPDKPKPLDKIGLADLGPDGRIRQLLMILIGCINMELPRGKLLTVTKNLKPLQERLDFVRGWVEQQFLNPRISGLIEAKYSELSESFVHVVRAVNAAGLFDQLVALLVQLLSDRALSFHSNVEAFDDDL